MRLEFDVTYTDGTVDHIKVRPKHFVAIEDQGIPLGDSLKGSFQIAHLASGRPETFEEWLELVDDLDTITTDNGSGPRPTQEESPTSP